MSDVRIEWTTAHVTADAVLRVDLGAEVSAPWVAEFERLAASWGSEGRGQTWTSVVLEPDHRTITVRGLNFDAEPAGLQVYLGDLVRYASEGSQHASARALQDAQEAMDLHSGRAEDAARLTEAFRSAPAD